MTDTFTIPVDLIESANVIGYHRADDVIQWRYESAPAKCDLPGAWQQESWFPMLPESSTSPTKACPSCGRPDLPLSSFCRNSARKDGLNCYCRECMASYRATHRDEMQANRRLYNAEHPEEYRAYHAAYRADHRNELCAASAAWRVVNPEKRKASDAAWRAAHPEQVRATHAAWGAAHPKERAAHSHNRKARLRGALGSHTAADEAAQYERQRGKCYWGLDVNPSCAVSLRSGYHVDHVVPIILDGSNDVGNIVLACPNCNLRKHAKHPMDWAGRML